MNISFKRTPVKYAAFQHPPKKLKINPIVFANYKVTEAGEL